MKSLFLISIFVFIQILVSAQVSIEKTGSPDLKLYNMNALNTGISSRMLFKTGTYFTGSIGTTGTSTNAARLSFFTQSSADQNALLERMTILNNGLVGIGTVNPLYLFHVKAPGFGITQESSNGTAQIGFYTSSGEAYIQTHNSVPLYFATNNSSAQMTLTTSGRLGIGTTTPVSKLEVRGKTKIVQQAGEDAALEINGTLKVSGTFPAAFIATASESQQIIIDHPASNNNPNAIILVTPRRDPDTYFNGSLAVEYATNLAKWRIIPIGVHDLGPGSVSLRACDGGCYNSDRVAYAEDNYFVTGNQWWNADTFNVLIIAK